MTQATPSSPSPAAQPLFLFNSYQRARLLLVTASFVCFLVFFFVSRGIGLPADPGFTASLLQQPHLALDLVVVLALLLLSTLIGTAIAGSIRSDAGLLAASLGLLAVSVRGGSIGTTLRAAATSGVFSSLAVETLILFAFLAACWYVLQLLQDRGFLLPDHLRDGVESEDDSMATRLQATAVCVIIMILLMLLLTQSQDKVQVLCAVALSAFVAAAGAHSVFPVSPSIFFWISPCIVALVGYLYSAANPGPTWLIGLSPTPLASPLPIDYASVGTAASLVGYWMSRRWLRAREERPVSAPPPPAVMG